ncbi:MAG TPA: hypothetical protein VFE62_11895 [Gemmataceae bacterium]|nr:hypothetical protein [Gemmataceae bacterium]
MKATRLQIVVITGLMFTAVAVPAGWNYVNPHVPPETARGRADAEIDLAKGHFEIKTGGKPAEPHPGDYQDLLRERYGVWISNAGCMTTFDQMNYRRGYNEVQKRGIIRHFGKDVFAECERDAR